MQLTDTILKIIFNCKGCVYGGFLRDSISGDDPIDIDAVIPDKYYRLFTKSRSEEHTF